MSENKDSAKKDARKDLYDQIGVTRESFASVVLAVLSLAVSGLALFLDVSGHLNLRSVLLISAIYIVLAVVSTAIYLTRVKKKNSKNLEEDE